MARRMAYRNARLLDPATGLDAVGTLLTEGGTIADFGPGLLADGVPDGIEAIDLGGQCLAPGLIDMRVTTGEREEATHEAAAAGGVTAMVCLPPGGDETGSPSGSTVTAAPPMARAASPRWGSPPAPAPWPSRTGKP